ncbi:MAG: 2-oxoglutarate dehydrogenase E1 component [Anaerolineae bacterium]|nr:2-oxoglutarate dehydrogenase E1 component [Anaerolineae bacterium]MCI0608060.1 2-oxoglutarate dehydrogenase E1 component [Anaerolineae bacterium]
MTLEKDFHGPNLGYILELHQRYLNDPNSVDEATRKLFAQWSPNGIEPALPLSVSTLSTPGLLPLTGAMNLAQAIRSYGYLSAKLDPLGGAPAPTGDPLLTFEFHHLQKEDLLNLPAEIFNLPQAQPAENAHQAIEILLSIYCGTIGYDYGHIRIPEERTWLYQTAETGRYRPPQQTVDEKRLLERLTQIEVFELFLHRIYPGKTRFSIEGLDMLIPMLNEIIASASDEKIRAVLIGMAHRGRLNVLAHILQKPYSQILAEFSDPKGRATTWDELGWTGDVKYHMGAYRSLGQDKDVEMLVHMPPNPSHLEQIDPVVAGMARAANTKADSAGAPRYFENESLPILIHGDASFAGQGIVSETLNFSHVAGYATSGSLHIIANNQLGFTATEGESRSSLHASDLAKGFEIPVIHVNADDPFACMEAARTALAYRQKFRKDFVINLIGYRRYGHNEGDEPRFTQPVMYQKIDAHPTIRQLWADTLEKEGLITQDEAEELLQSHLKDLQEANDQLDAEKALVEPVPQPPPRGAAQKVKTAITLKRLKELNRSLLEFPKDFHLNPKLVKAVERRRMLFDKSDDGKIDWATAEELAFASILEDGTPIRLTGQDSARGTFSQRHAVFYDAETNQSHIPLQTIPQAGAAFEVLNSPLSEIGAIGFEVGYNIMAPDRLVIWEAQYGDFVNNAQGVLDEFLFSSRAKWGLTPSLVLLLPHGNEGQGPDHSSARIERFLGLAAEINVRIAYPSTSAQYFHLLRRQALLLKTDPLPMVVFTPKGLLRHPLTASSSNEMTTSNWQRVIDDADLPGKKTDVKNLILCSGRIYVDLVTSKLRKENHDNAIVRVEQLYPFPKQELEELLSEYPNLEGVIWVQEEPLNMGAWNYLRPRLRQLTEDRLPLHYVGRPESSSPAEGSSTLYRINQQSLIEQAFKLEKQAGTSSVVKERG